MEEFPEIRYLKIPRWFLPVFLFSFILASVVVIYKNQSRFAFGKIFGNRVAEAQGVGSKVCGINIDPTNPAGDPGGGTFAGVGWVRLVFKSHGASGLSNLQQSYDFYDTRINSYKAAGTKVLLVLNQETYWGCAPWNNSGCVDQYASEFATMAKDIASHYSGKVDAFEIWNEPDLQDLPVNPSILGRIANRAIPEIRSVSNSYIMLGGFGSGADSILGYINGMGLTQSIDAVSVHPYGQGAGGKGEVFGKIEDYLNRIDDVGIPVWITEIGMVCSECSAAADYLEAFYDAVSGKISVVIWFGWSDGMVSGFGITDVAQNVKEPIYSRFYEKGCDSSVVLPQPGGGGIPKGDGEWTGPGAREGCITDTQTPLFPGTKELKGKENATLLLKEGFGNVAGVMSIESVTVAEYIQGTEIESKGDTPPHSNSAEFKNTLSYDAYYNLKPNYPADGTVEAEANITVASWVNQKYKDGAGLGNEYIPLDTSNDVSDFPEGSSGYGEGFGVIKKADYVYFPLGTALGAIAQDPYNYFSFYKRPSDFITEMPVAFDKSFLGGQSAHVNFYIDALDKILSLLGRLEKLLGLRGIFDFFRLGTPNPKSAVMDGNEVNIEKYYRGDRAPGEQGIELGEFIFQQDCEAFDETAAAYDVKIAEIQNEINQLESDIDFINTCKVGEPGCPADKAGEIFWRRAKINELNQQIDKMGELQPKVRALANECHGEGKRRAKIEGKLSLTAPFVPILAHERYKDIFYTSGGSQNPRPVCSAPEEGLYAAEVRVNVKFYDRNQAKFNAYKTCKPNGETGGNLLTDGFMESAGKGFSGVSGNVPGGWDAFWLKKPGEADRTDFGQSPEFVIQGRDPDPRRVLQGNTALKWFTAFSTHDVIMYEIINLSTGGSYDLSGYYQGWRVQYDSPDTGACPLSDPSYTGGSFSEVCVIEIGKMGIGGFPSGDVGEAEFNDWVKRFIDNNQYAHCSHIEEGMDQWNEHFVSGNFGGRVAVVVRGASPQYPVFVNDDYWDNFCFVPSGNLFDQEYEIIEAPEPEIKIGECPLVKRPLGSCKIQGIGGVSDTATLINEDLDFYMPGLGVIPYLRERIVVGDAKSPDRKAADLKYCEVDPEKPFPYPISYLDIYIIQNLQPESLAIKWAKAIYPKFEVEEIVSIRQGEPIEQNPKFAKLWEEMEGKNKAEINGGEVWIE